MDNPETLATNRLDDRKHFSSSVIKLNRNKHQRSSIKHFFPS